MGGVGRGKGYQYCDAKGPGLAVLAMFVSLRSLLVQALYAEGWNGTSWEHVPDSANEWWRNCISWTHRHVTHDARWACGDIGAHANEQAKVAAILGSKPVIAPGPETIF